MAVVRRRVATRADPVTAPSLLGAAAFLVLGRVLGAPPRFAVAAVLPGVLEALLDRALRLLAAESRGLTVLAVLAVLLASLSTLLGLLAEPALVALPALRRAVLALSARLL